MASYEINFLRKAKFIIINILSIVLSTNGAS